MGLELIPLSCNKCGAPLEVAKGTNFATCTYCGSRLAVHYTGGAAYTEVLDRIDQKTDAILGHVQQITEHAAAKWEEVQIVWGTGGSMFRAKMYFFAAANGPHGQRTVATSPEFGHSTQSIGRGRMIPARTRDAEQALAALVQDLLAQGWEHQAGGEYWFSRQLRRKVK